MLRQGAQLVDVTAHSVQVFLRWQVQKRITTEKFTGHDHLHDDVVPQQQYNACLHEVHGPGRPAFPH